MSSSINELPSGEKLHIGIFGKRNSGKSSLMNALCNQPVSIVSHIAGTTTDCVTKSIEIPGIGACVLMDTAGFDDEGELGRERIEKTQLAALKTDIAIILFNDNDFAMEKEWYQHLSKNSIPVLLVVSKSDELNNPAAFCNRIKECFKASPISVSSNSHEGLDVLIEELVRNIPEDFGNRCITGNLVKNKMSVLLVMPQDIEAPKGRLILPQVQTIRELLDKKCIITCVTEDALEDALESFKNAPDLIITDSQVFKEVYNKKPEKSLLTSFSVLFAAYKGDIEYYVESTKRFKDLDNNSKVLIAECCTHAPVGEDIGRIKIPNMLRKKYGKDLTVDIVSGTDFPKHLNQYDLIIQCGGCMFNRRYVLNRIEAARESNVPMTNYGITIAYLSGILDKITYS